MRDERKFLFIGDLVPYREEIHGTRKRQYNRLLEQADRYLEVKLPVVHPKESTTYMGIAIVNLALSYLLSREEKYLSEARRFMNAVMSYEKWGNAHLVDVDLSASWILFGLSLGYDWLKQELPAEERNRAAAAIEHHVKIIYDYRRDTYGHGWSTAFYQNHNWINMTGLAAAGYALSGEAEDARCFIDESKTDFERVFSYLADDGSNYEGVPYWRYGGMWLFVYAHLLKVQEGCDYFRTSDYLRNTFYYRLYQSSGDLRQQMNFGDSHDRHSGHTACVYYKTAAEYGDGFAQTFGNLVSGEFLMEEAQNSKVKPGILPEAAFEFLWYDPSVKEKDLSLLPVARYFDDLGLLSVRENWGCDSKILTIKCGYPGGKKQWETGFRLLREEKIQCLSLSHHHPDNLSYLFARGGEYLTCEDGYNRNIMPDNHNVILVDGIYTDAYNVNDVYMESVRLRTEQENGAFDEIKYGGKVTTERVDGSVVLYRGETSGVYPVRLHMKEVSRLLFTDGLSFWIFADVCRSDSEHHFQIISNTDRRGEIGAAYQENAFRYPMKSGDILYTIFSDKDMKTRQYRQEVVSVMTTQEPDKVCRTDIETLCTESAKPQRQQIFYECFSFEKEGTQFGWDGETLTVEHKEKTYRIMCKYTEDESGAGFAGNELSVSPVQIQICNQSGCLAEYHV